MPDHLLPPSASGLERALSDAAGRIDNLKTPIRDVWNPSLCPVALLPWLAWARSVDVWETDWSEDQKRDTVRSSLRVHQYKGTIGAIREALDALGFPIRVQEWFRQEPLGRPFTFRLIMDVDQVGVPQDAAKKFLPVVEAAKNLRSQLDTIELRIENTADSYNFGYSLLGQEITMPPADEQFAGLIEGFMASEAVLDQITNVGLPAALRIQ